jgi:hypothetical protein
MIRVRFETAPPDALRRVLAARFRLVAGGGSAWRWEGAIARFAAEGELDEALAAVDALTPIREVDRGAGFEPFSRHEEPSEGLDFVELPEAVRPAPAPVPEDVLNRFVFDDHVVAAPDGRYVAFVRDARRCHFETLHLVGGNVLAPIALPVIHDRPRTAFSSDGRRLLVGGPLDVLEVDLESGVLTPLDHDDDANGFDVCYLDARRAAAIGWHALTVYHLDGDLPPRRIPCHGGRLLRAVLDGRVLIAGTESGTFILGIRDHAMRLLYRDWRSLAAVWEEAGRVLCSPAGECVCELRGLEPAWTQAFSSGGDEPDLTLA